MILMQKETKCITYNWPLNREWKKKFYGLGRSPNGICGCGFWMIEACGLGVNGSGKGVSRNHRAKQGFGNAFCLHQIW